MSSTLARQHLLAMLHAKENPSDASPFLPPLDPVLPRTIEPFFGNIFRRADGYDIKKAEMVRPTEYKTHARAKMVNPKHFEVRTAEGQISIERRGPNSKISLPKTDRVPVEGAIMNPTPAQVFNDRETLERTYFPNGIPARSSSSSSSGSILWLRCG